MTHPQIASNNARSALSRRFKPLALMLLACCFLTPHVGRAATVYVSGSDGILVVGSGGSTTGGTVFATPEGFTSRGIAFDSSGNLYIGRYTSSSTVSEVGPGGSTTGGTTFATGFGNPLGIAFDSSGNLYVANGNNLTVSSVGSSGGVGAAFATGLDLTPRGLAFDSSGNLYISDGSNISRDGSAGGEVSVFAGVSGGYGLAFDTSGNLYVSESGTGNISKITIVNGIYSSQDDSWATGFSTPRGIAFDSSGNLYVANSGGSTIGRVGPGGGAATTFASGFTNAPQFLAIQSDIPEPATTGMLALGIALLFLAARRNRRTDAKRSLEPAR